MGQGSQGGTTLGRGIILPTGLLASLTLALLLWATASGNRAAAASPNGALTEGQHYYYLPWPGARRDQYVILDDPRCGAGMVYIKSVSSDYAQCAAQKDMQPVAAQPVAGAKGSLQWLTGRWRGTYIGATVDTVHGNWVWRQEEGGARGGLLQINADRSYAWEQPSGVIRGNWRPAGTTEMTNFEGEGIVLLQGESGWDWLVVMQQDTSVPGENVEVLDLGTRNLRRLAQRVR